MTVVTADFEFGKYEFNANIVRVASDEEGRITGFTKIRPKSGVECLSTNILLVKRTYLIGLVENAAAKGQTDFYLDALLPKIGCDKLFVYHHRKYYAVIGYYQAGREITGNEQGIPAESGYVADIVEITQEYGYYEYGFCIIVPEP